MANSYLKVYIHYVFSTKNREPLISPSIEKQLWAYMAGVSKEICRCDKKSKSGFFIMD